jgi:hypothetical protein
MQAQSHPAVHDGRHQLAWGAAPYARSRRPWLLAVLTLACIALVVAGSFGPWLYIERGPEWAIEVERMRGTNTDGVFSLFFALVATVLLLVALIRPSLWPFAVAAFVALLFCTLVGLFDWVIFDPMDLADEPGKQASLIRVEWGLKLLTVAAPAAAVFALLFARTLIRGDY